MNLSESGFALLIKCLKAHNPSLIPIVEANEMGGFSDDFYNQLREIVCDEFCDNGLMPDSEPNEYGLELEDLIDEIGRFFIS